MNLINYIKRNPILSSVTIILILVVIYMIYDVTRTWYMIEGLEETLPEMPQEMMEQETIPQEMIPPEMMEQEMTQERIMEQEIIPGMAEEEMMQESVPPLSTSGDVLQNAIQNGNPVYFRFDKQVITIEKKTEIKPLYLGVIQKKDCEYRVQGKPIECDFVIAILQPEKNEFTKMMIYEKTDDGGEKYNLIRNMSEKIQPSYPYLSQILNINNKSKALCFDPASDDTNTKCLIEKSNLGYVIKFRKQSGNSGTFQDYFVSECQGNQQKLCKMGQSVFPRICLSNNAGDAINFKIEA